MTELRLLPHYEAARLKRGRAQAVSAILRSTYFEASIVDEEAVEVDVPASPAPVLIFTAQPRPRLYGDLLGKRVRKRWSPDEIVFIPAQQPSWWATQGGGSRVLHVHFHAKEFERASLELSARETQRPLMCHRRPTFQRFRNAMTTEMLSGHPAGKLFADALGLLAIHQLNDCFADRPVAPPTRGGLAPWQLKRACEAMEAKLDADIGLDDLARIAGCSATHFSRAFKQSTGIAPFQWLGERRIERAKDLLANQRIPLAEIALAVGFAAQPQFTTAFGRATGVTPGAWRRERAS